MRFLVDVMARPDDAKAYDVIRIDHPDVLALIGRAPGEARRYSLADLEATWPGHPIAGFVKDGGLYCLVGSSPDNTLTARQLDEMRDRLRIPVPDKNGGGGWVLPVVIGGSIIGAAAIVAQYDQAWAAESAWGGMVKTLVRDTANPSRSDTAYPFLRGFDVYAGHGWASGHQGFAAGNNQESSSEGQNFANALILAFLAQIVGVLLPALSDAAAPALLASPSRRAAAGRSDCTVGSASDGWAGSRRTTSSARRNRRPRSRATSASAAMSRTPFSSRRAPG